VVREATYAVVPRVEQGTRLRTDQALDSERGGQRHTGEPDPVLVVRLDTSLDVVVRRVDVERWFAARVERPTPQVRSPLPGPEPVDELLRPQVLVQVGRQWLCHVPSLPLGAIVD
jgi:hypothetical protein